MRFVCFEHGVFPGYESFPKVIDIHGSNEKNGGLGTTYPFDFDGKHRILKCSRNRWHRIEFSTMRDSNAMPAKWRAFHQEYVKLVELNGLDGHAPRAYAFGAAVVEEDGISWALPAFVMEDMSDKATGSLQEVLDNRDSGFSAVETAAFGKQLLDIIALQRECGITHADLSNNNVLVSVEGTDHIAGVYVIDYGSAKYEDSGVTPPPYETVGIQATPRLATLRFGAPEIFPLVQGLHPDQAAEMPDEELEENYRWRNNVAVDLWSFGALLFYMRTRALPEVPIFFDAESGCYRDPTDKDTIFKQEEAYWLLVKKKREGLSLPDAYRTEGDAGLRSIIDFCTQPSPKERNDGFTGIREQIDALYSLTHTHKGTTTGDRGIGPDDTPSLNLMGVKAVQCKMYEGRKAYSADSTADIVIFIAGGSTPPEKVTVGKHTYNLKIVEQNDIPEKGLTSWAGLPSCPWQNVEFARFSDRVSPKNLSNWFNGCSRLKRVMKIDNLDTSEATSMRGMFQGCSSLEALSVYGFDTSNMTDMSSAFRGCKKLTYLDISQFYVANVKDAKYMFSGCTALKTLEGFPSVFSANEQINPSELGSDCPAVDEYLGSSNNLS